MYSINGKEEHYIFENKHLADINPLFVGRESCDPGKQFGPAIRYYTLIHYVKSGKGKVVKSKGVFEVSAGQAFIIYPNEVVTYIADKDEPWSYCWVAFDGALSKQFYQLNDVIYMKYGIFEDMFHNGEKDMCEYRVAAQLFELYAELFSMPATSANYVNQAKDYIKALYMKNITVEQIADHLNLDRRYLSRLFKQKTGMTMQDYIIKQRISAAQTYLTQGFSVNESATLSGYTDTCNFSKMFKQKTGMSPAEWKKTKNSI